MRAWIAAGALWCIVSPLSAQATTAPPKIAVVVSGDPEPALIEAARGVTEGIRSAPELRGPSDPGVVAALRGEPAPSQDDGLGGVRALRRRLGWSDGRDLAILRDLGRGVGASLVAVLRSQDGSIRLEVFDVEAARLYEGSLDLSGGGDPLTYVAARARATRRRARSDGAPGESARDDTGESEPPASTTGGEAAAASRAAHVDLEAPPDRPARAWLRHNWAYLVGGALLAAVGIGYAVSAGGDGGSSSPSLRFRPGP